MLTGNNQESRLKIQSVYLRGRALAASGRTIRDTADTRKRGVQHLSDHDIGEIIAEVSAIETNCRLIREALGMPATTDYRLKLTDSMRNVSYLNRSGKSIDYAGSNGIPFSLANICHNDARGMEFQLIDARNATEAVEIIKRHASYRFTVEIVA